MAVALNPYLTLPGTAAQAVAFYADVFGGTPEVMTFGDAGAEGAPPEQVMHASLRTDQGFVLMLSDTPPGAPPAGAGNVAVSLSGDDLEVLRGWWARLSEGGTVTVPMERQVWGDEFGACLDRFGVSWMVDAATGEQPG